jgi:hypothetical protein
VLWVCLVGKEGELKKELARIGRLRHN